MSDLKKNETFSDTKLQKVPDGGVIALDEEELAQVSGGIQLHPTSSGDNNYGNAPANPVNQYISQPQIPVEKKVTVTMEISSAVQIGSLDHKGNS